MAHRFTLNLTGRSGRGYSFQVFDLDTQFEPVGAVYSFLTLPALLFAETTVLYVGKANNLSRRIAEHKAQNDKWSAALEAGFSLIGATAVANEVDRVQVERDLIESYSPRLNEQHNHLAQLFEAMTPKNALAGFPLGLKRH